MGDETITIRKESLWKYSTFILAALLIVTLFLYMGKDTVGSTGNAVQNTVPAQGVPSPSARVEVSVDDDAVLGDKDAPVTIIEFSDYQ